MRIKLFTFILLLIGGYSPIIAQPLDSATLTIEGIVTEGLKIVSGDHGEHRDWEAFSDLFIPNAQLSVLVHDSIGNAEIHTYTVKEFIKLGKQMYEQDGFIEYEITKTIDSYNGIVHVFQSYYAKELDFEERGINSYQLIFDGHRWWISNLLWTSNRNGIELPEVYK